MPERPQTPGEEIANSVSHGAALLAALVGLPFLIATAVQHGERASVVGAGVFAASLLLVYLASTLYHALPPNRAKRFMQVVDHVAIFLLIAGTYTPFTLGVLRGAWGWTLFGLVWGLGLAGVLLKVHAGVRHPRLSIALYLATGWVALVAARPLWVSMEAWGLFWLLAGGLAYTAGVGFFLADRIRYYHFIWHLCVIAGSACHFVAVMHYSG